MIFDADIDQITRLDSVQLVQLMKRLMLAECRLIDVPLRAATVPLQITVADGGEDGRVEWCDGADETDFFPSHFCIFQSKAQNLTEAKILAEVLKKPKKGKPRLNSAVSEVLSRRGAYVVFCSHAFSGSKIAKLRKAIEGAIRRGHKRPSDAAAIEVYDANRIADWVNTHPAVALWLAALQRRRSLAGFKSHDSWGRDSDIKEVVWVNNDIPRFAHVSIDIEESESNQSNQSRSLWSFKQAAESILRMLALEKVALRIVGPSGFGKTRFAFELFNRRVTTPDEVERIAIIYANIAIVGDEAVRLADEIADSGSPTIMVVDECSDELHTNLVVTARRAGSRLRFVTIDVESEVTESADVQVLRLDPAPDETIGAIARSIGPNLNDTDIRSIQELSKGFPKMAILAAQQQGIGMKAIRSAQQFLDRIVWGRRQKDNEAQRAIELLSLFEWVGLNGTVADESALIANKLGGMTHASFIEHIKSFRSRGILVERGDYVQVAPIPLAASLGRHRLSLLSPDILVGFFLEATERLKGSFLRRIRWLDTSADAKVIACQLLDTECLGNFNKLNSNVGGECLDHLVHVDPDLAMATIQRVFGNLTTEQLGGVTLGRRNLVRALEKLAFRHESFDDAATLLRRLAVSENEGNISNNATGQFTQLYQLYLSGTEAPPAARLLVLDDGLRSPNPMEREVCVEALDKMLDSDHFTRGGGAEELGSRARLKDWKPKTFGEIWDFQRAAIKRLIEIAVNDDPLPLRAKQILGSHIRSLINALSLDEVRAMISSIVSRYGFWVEAVQKVNQWLYFDRRKAPRERGMAVRAYFEELLPSDPVDLAVLYTHGWQSDFHDPDVDYEQEERSQIDFEYAARKSIELAEVIVGDPDAVTRSLDKLCTSDAKTVFAFARRLAELASNPVELFGTAIAIVEQKQGAANRQMFSGLIAGTDSRDQHSARECIRLTLRSGKLKNDAISMIGSGRLEPADIRLVVTLLRSGDVKPRQCALLSYSRGSDHLAHEHIAPLLDELSRHGGEGLWAALDIISMILHGDKEPTKTITDVLRNVLVDPALFENADSIMDGHNLGTLVKLLSRHNLIDRGFARALVRQFVSICTQNRARFFYDFASPVREGLSALIDAHPQEVWSGVVRVVQGKNSWARQKLENLITLSHNDHLGSKLLYALPAKLYLDWVRKDPARRAAIVVDWLPIATKAEDGSLNWHPTLQNFIEEFGNEASVLRALSMRLRPRSWSGSLVPHLRPLLTLLNSWSVHKRAEVRQWVRNEKAGIESEIKNEQRRDDEDAVRFS